MVLHESLSAIFVQLSLIVPSIKTSVVKLAKMLCVKAKLKEESEIPVLKLVSLFRNVPITVPYHACAVLLRSSCYLCNMFLTRLIQNV